MSGAERQVDAVEAELRLAGVLTSLCPECLAVDETTVYGTAFAGRRWQVTVPCAVCREQA